MKGSRPIPITRTVPLLMPISGFLISLALMQSVEWGSLMKIVFVIGVSIGIGIILGLRSLCIFLSGCILGCLLLIVHADDGSDMLRTLMVRGDVRTDEPVELIGVVRDVPEISPKGFSFELDTRSVVTSRFCMPSRGAVSIRVTGRDSKSPISAGSAVRVTCVPRREEMFRNPGGFSYVEHLELEGIDAACNLKSPMLIEVSSGTDRMRFDVLGAFRNHVIERLVSSLGPMHGGIVAAVVLGNKEFLDGRAAELFRQGGTFHLLIISGMHMTFIAGIVLFVASVLLRSPWARFIVVAPVIWAYAEMVGWDRPVTRACLMFTLMLFGRCLFRRPDPLNLILATAAISLVPSPADIFTASFQLTSLSVLAITSVASPVIERIREMGRWGPNATHPFPPRPGLLRSFAETIHWDPKEWDLRSRGNDWSGVPVKHPFIRRRPHPSLMRFISYVFEGIVATVSVQIVLLPLQIVLFHRVTPVSLLLNLIIAPIIAVQAVIGLLALLMDGFASRIGRVLSSLAVAIGELGLIVSQLSLDSAFGEMRMAVYDGSLGAVYVIHMILTMVFTLMLRNWNPFDQIQRTSPGLRLAMAGLLCTSMVMVFTPFAEPVAEGRLTVSFLDVGQGDSTFIVFPNGRTMLVDAGGTIAPSSSSQDADFVPDSIRVGESVVSEFLWEKGHSRIDYVLATHSDADHIQGLRDILRNFDVGVVYLGRMNPESKEFRELLSVAARRGVRVTDGFAGDLSTVGGVRIEMMNPPVHSNMKSINEGSLVTRMTFGRHRFLLTGDIESDGESFLLSQKDISADVVKVAHHGSRTSSSPAFVKSVGATHAVIPVGRRSRFGHPHPEVLARWKDSGAITMTTGAEGTITLSTDGRELRCETFVGKTMGLNGGSGGCR